MLNSAQAFTEALLAWYERYHRNLPWRQSRDAYAIWISEIMLQQTQVVTVQDYYRRFIERFPNVFTLAQADEEVVFKLWEGLGYYSRARNLMRCAQVVVSEFDGVFPSDVNKLRELPGIGPYTAGAIASIAYEKMVPAVDGNVMRILARIDADSRDIADAKTKLAFEALVMEKMTRDPRHFNQALMELGAMICTPKGPKCTQCPVKDFCEAKQKGCVDRLPVKKKKQKAVHQNIAIVCLKHEGRFLFVKQPASGLMSHLWVLPYLEIKDGNDADKIIKQYCLEYFGEVADYVAMAEGIKHVFSHLIWHPTLYVYEVSHEIDTELPMTKWASLEESKALALPTAIKKQLTAIKALEVTLDSPSNSPKNL